MESKTFCPLPWTQAASTTDGYYRPCCEFKWEQNEKTVSWQDSWQTKADKITYIKSQLLDNKKPKECNICWKKEAVGIESLREQSLKMYKQPYELVSIDLKLGNLCNLGCRMCEPHSSSVLKQEVLKNALEWTDTDLWTANQHYNEDWVTIAFDKISKLENLKYLKFTGGEPFANPNIMKFLKSLHNPENIEISFITNALLISDDKLEVLNRFKKKTLYISCDAIGDLYEYIRWPGKWKNFENRFNKLILERDIELKIFVTVSAYNVFYIPETLEYFLNRGMEISLIFVEEPTHLHPWVHRLEYRDKIKNKYNKYPNLNEYLKDILELENKYDDKLNATFKKQTQLRDTLRKQQYVNF